MHWLEKWLLPSKCVLTGEGSGLLDISEYLVDTWSKPEEVCPQCCEPSPSSQVCGACLTQTPSFDRTQVGFYFEEELAGLVHGLKYQNRLAYSRILAELLVKSVDAEAVDAVVAVPLHLNRRRSRGYNQAELIAQEMARILQIPLIRDGIERVVDTPFQTHLDADERRRNLKGAFKVVPEAFSAVNRIALVDDVITTGATMQQLASEIKSRTDIEWIEAWAVAKTK